MIDITFYFRSRILESPNFQLLYSEKRKKNTQLYQFFQSMYLNKCYHQFLPSNWFLLIHQLIFNYNIKVKLTHLGTIKFYTKLSSFILKLSTKNLTKIYIFQQKKFLKYHFFFYTYMHKHMFCDSLNTQMKKKKFFKQNFPKGFKLQNF